MNKHDEESLMALVESAANLHSKSVRWEPLRFALREVLAERSAMIDNVRFARERAEKAEAECERLRKEIANLDYRAAYEALEQENVQLRKDVERLRKLLSDLWKCECYGWTEELADSITIALKDQP